MPERAASATPSHTFIESVGIAAKRFPERAAVVSRGGSIAYRELWEKSAALATFIEEEAGSGNEPLVIFGHKSPLVLVCMIACARSGHAYVPVDVSTPLARTHDILSQTESPLVFCVETLDATSLTGADAGTDGKALPSSIRFLDAETIADEIARHEGRVPAAEDAVCGEDTYYIIFTSGSTGAPKGVEVTASCLDHFYTWPLELAHSHADTEEPKVFLNQALFSFDLSVYELAMSLSSGGTLACADTPLLADTRAFFDFLVEERTQVWSVTPSFLEMCLVDHSFSSELLPDLESALACGEVLPASTARKFMTRFPNARLYNTYGPTESTVAVTAILMTPELCAEDTRVPVGYAKPGTVLSIIDPDTEPGTDPAMAPRMAAGEVGEIVITGTTVAKGYYHRLDLTDAKFDTVAADSPAALASEEFADGAMIRDSSTATPCAIRSFRTGDLGSLAPDGCLDCNGRADSQVKLNGFRIELGDIENNLAALPGVRTAAVVCVSRGGKPSYLAAFIALEDTVEIAADVAEANVLDTQTIAVRTVASSTILADKKASRTFGQSLKAQLKERIPHYMVPRKIVLRDVLPLNRNGKIDRRSLTATL